MLPRARGSILNVASLGGFVPGPHQAAYYASKSYVLSLTEAVAEEAAGRGVRIAVLAPGPVATGFHRDMGAAEGRYLRVFPVMSAESVARSAVRGLRLGRRVMVPGIAGPAVAYALRVLPRPAIRPLMAALLEPVNSASAVPPRDKTGA
jgi:short-subunit dehydrogenase